MSSVIEIAKARVIQAMCEVFDIPVEHRRAVRRPFLGSATVSLTGASSNAFTAFARDVSTLGIGLVHTQPIDCGEVVVRLHQAGGRSIAFRTEILWCKDFGDGWYASGGRFLDVVE